ncbi:nuclear pore complex protein Nup93-1 [Drosophila pseudoobscura]|uniref:Nuclear pore protein n=1 Tax=Drosophila pseudoobscura pseudoobscura TaxID=46245 RepID=Q29H07_DROPS|nr:nuclear pore complex protein Nup93-1 [Drosophila pseudoobscura]
MELEDLLQQAQCLTNDTRMDEDMPRVDRTISQVLQATQELHSRVTLTGTHDLKAHMLLGSKGVDLPKLSQKLETLSARKTFEPLDPVSDTDVHAFLKNERENAILSVIDETNRGIFESVERHKWRRIYAEWGEEKESLLNALIGPKQNEFPDVRRQTVLTTLAETPMPSSRLSRTEELYAQEIASYNQSQIQRGHRPNLLAAFANLAAEKFDNQLVSEMWSVLQFMADNAPPSRTSDAIKSRLATQKFVQQARTYLERRYKQYINTVIKENPLQAQRGGIPNVYSSVNSFVSINFAVPATLVGLLDVYNGLPLWALVYYSLRCGDLGAAVRYLKETGVCYDLYRLLLMMKEGTKGEQYSRLEGALKLEYNSKLRNCSDPYKKAVFAYVLACDPHNSHAELMRSIDDFLWMQLSILRQQDGREYNVEQLTYSGLQSLILEKYGENYFNAREKAPLYFSVLVLTGQFESAIEFLARTEDNRPHAVHMAIALNEIHMLGTPSSMHHPLISVNPEDPAPMKRLNLVRMLVTYAKCFEITNTSEALQYYFLLRHFKDDNGRSLMLSCVSDLLVENCDQKMIDLIFGDKDDNSGQTGIFAQFHTMDFDKYMLAGMVGDELTYRSNFETAIWLYFIGGQLDKVMRLVCSLLSQVVQQPPTESSMRTRLRQIIIHLEDLRSVQRVDVEPHVLATYTMLTQLLVFFDHYHKNESQQASEVLANFRITPNDCSEVEECVANLKSLCPEVTKVLPDILLAAMDLIYEEYTKIKGNGGSRSSFDSRESTQTDDWKNENKEGILRHLRTKAKALTNMAATVAYRMPTATNKRLVQLEILMH